MTWWILFFLVLIVLVYLYPDIFIGGFKLDSRQTSHSDHHYNAIIYPNDIPTDKTELKLPDNIKYMQSHLSIHGINRPGIVLHVKNQMYNNKNVINPDYTVTMSYDFKNKRWTTIGQKVKSIDYYSFILLFKALSDGINNFSNASNTLYTKGYNAKDMWQEGKYQCLRRLGGDISLIVDAYANEILKKSVNVSNVWTRSVNNNKPEESLFSRFLS